MDEPKKLLVLMTSGLDDERSSVALSIANGGITAGLEVTLFLTSSAVDWARKGAADAAHPNPMDPPIKDMLDRIMESGKGVLVCPPCAKVRGYGQEDLIEGVTLIGSSAIHELIKQGAEVLTF